MCYVCELEIECEDCPHYRYLEERDSMVCFAESDMEEENAKSKDTAEKN